MANSKLSAQIKNRFSHNTVESDRGFSDIPGSLVKEAKQSVSAAGEDFFSQLLGVGKFETTDQNDPQGGVKAYEKFTLYDSDRKTVAR